MSRERKTSSRYVVPLNDAALGAVRVAHSRNGTNRRVVLSEWTGKPFEHPRHGFDPTQRKAKIAGFDWHDLRYTLPAGCE